MAPLRSLLSLALLSLLAGCSGTTPSDEARLGAESYQLSVRDVPQAATVGTPFTFELAASGEPGVTSDHIGAHYWADAAPSNPTAELSMAMACDHIATATAAPGVYDVTCTFDSAGTYHVYGHLRVVSDGETYDYWAPGQAITASA